MKELQNQIKNKNLKNIYLFYGPENYMRDFYIKQIKNLAVPNEDDAFNLMKMVNDIDFEALKGFVYSLPVFNDKKILIIKNSNIFKNVKEEAETKWLSILETLPQEVIIIFSENEVDRRKTLYKRVNSLGKAVAFEYQKEDALKKWAKKIISDQKMQISDENIDLLINLCPPDMNSILNEIAKLVFYKKNEGIIEKEDINLSVCKSIENKVFEMVDNATNSNTKTALDMFYDLKTLNEPPERIMANISAEYLKLRKTKILLEENADRAEISRQIKVPPFFVNGYIEKCKKLSLEKINDMIFLCQQSDYFMKNGLKDRWQVVENVIVQSQIK